MIRLVTSSLIESVAYENGILTVYFNNGSIYVYVNVPENIVNDLLNAESKGRYFLNNIRDRYTYTRVYTKI